MLADSNMFKDLIAIKFRKVERKQTRFYYKGQIVITTASHELKDELDKKDES